MFGPPHLLLLIGGDGRRRLHSGRHPVSHLRGEVSYARAFRARRPRPPRCCSSRTTRGSGPSSPTTSSRTAMSPDRHRSSKPRGCSSSSGPTWPSSTCTCPTAPAWSCSRGCGPRTASPRVWTRAPHGGALGPGAGELDRLRGFERGADDYLSKPFSTRSSRAGHGDPAAGAPRVELGPAPGRRPGARPGRAGGAAGGAADRPVAEGVRAAADARGVADPRVHEGRTPARRLGLSLPGRHGTLDSHACRLRQKLRGRRRVRRQRVGCGLPAVDGLPMGRRCERRGFHLGWLGGAVVMPRAGRRGCAQRLARHTRRSSPTRATSCAGPCARRGWGCTGSTISSGRRRSTSELQRAALALEDLVAAGSGRRAGARSELVDVGALLDDAAEAWRPLAAAFGAALLVEPLRGRALVRADPVRLAQACGNLVANAVEHGAGPVRVRGRVVAGRVRVEVNDAGPGLPAPRERAPVAASPQGGTGERPGDRSPHRRIARRPARAGPEPRGACLVLELPSADAAPGQTRSRSGRRTRRGCSIPGPLRGRPTTPPMTRRRRGALLVGLAFALGGLAASDVGRREAALRAQLAPLVDVVVAGRDLPPRRRLTPADLALRRVPARYAPSARRESPEEVLGRRPLGWCRAARTSARASSRTRRRRAPRACVVASARSKSPAPALPHSSSRAHGSTSSSFPSAGRAARARGRGGAPPPARWPADGADGAARVAATLRVTAARRSRSPRSRRAHARCGCWRARVEGGEFRPPAPLEAAMKQPLLAALLLAVAPSRRRHQPARTRALCRRRLLRPHRASALSGPPTAGTSAAGAIRRDDCSRRSRGGLYARGAGPEPLPVRRAGRHHHHAARRRPTACTSPVAAPWAAPTFVVEAGHAAPGSTSRPARGHLGADPIDFGGAGGAASPRRRRAADRHALRAARARARRRPALPRASTRSPSCSRRRMRRRVAITAPGGHLRGTVDVPCAATDAGGGVFERTLVLDGRRSPAARSATTVPASLGAAATRRPARALPAGCAGARRARYTRRSPTARIRWSRAWRTSRATSARPRPRSSSTTSPPRAGTVALAGDPAEALTAEPAGFAGRGGHLRVPLAALRRRRRLRRRSGAPSRARTALRPGDAGQRVCAPSSCASDGGGSVRVASMPSAIVAVAGTGPSGGFSAAAPSAPRPPDRLAGARAPPPPPRDRHVAGPRAHPRPADRSRRSPAGAHAGADARAHRRAALAPAHGRAHPPRRPLDGLHQGRPVPASPARLRPRDGQAAARVRAAARVTVRRAGALTLVSGGCSAAACHPPACGSACSPARGARWSTRATLRTDGLGRFSATGRAPAGVRLRIVDPRPARLPVRARGGAP